MTGPHASLARHLEDLLEVAVFLRRPTSSRMPKSRTRACTTRLSTRRRGAAGRLDWAWPFARSGKIMRRLLRDVTEGRELGDVCTLGDPTVVTTLTSRIAADGGGRALWTLW